MARSYTKSKRAENQAETRDRIVDAAIELHGDIGPSATTISMIAERAGVQRHTVYAHFPDDLSLFTACSGKHVEQHPLPTPEQWAGAAEPAQRLTAALAALYAWYDENQGIARNVLRDAETNDVMRQVAGKRFGGPIHAIYESLVTDLGAEGKAALTLALSFYTWRTLAQDARLKPEDAVALMVGTVLNADAK